MRWLKDSFAGMKDATLQNPLRKKRPHSCDLLISEKCNLRCVKCNFWQSDVTDHITISECKHIIDTLSQLGERPFEVNFGGGEPLLVDGIIDLVKYALKRGLEPALSTNATLITADMAKRLGRSGLNRMSISLDSLDANVHDEITGIPGTYQKVMEAIDHLSVYWKSGQINIHTVLSARNIGGIIDLVEWVNQHSLFSGINIQAVSQPFRSHPIDAWYDSDEYRFLWPQDVRAVHEVLDEIIARKKKGYKIINPLHQFKVYKIYYEHPERFARKFRCNFGDYTMNINALGLMHLCPFMKPLGSLRLSEVDELWFSPQAEEARVQMNNCRKSCNNILNCFFEEEDIKAGFVDDVAVRIEDSRTPQIDSLTEDPQSEAAEPITFCNLNITPECHLPCKMCFIWENSTRAQLKNFKQNGLTLGEWRWTIDSIASLNTEQKRIYFSGGEPLLRPGFWNLIRFARDKGFFTMLGTSCYPMNTRRAQQLVDSGLHFINVSLDSFNPKTHDHLRGRRGIYKKVMSSARWLKKMNPDLEIGVSCVISKANMAEIPELVERIDTDGLFSSIYFQALAQPYDTPACNYWYRLKEYRFLWPDEAPRIDDLFDALIEKKKNGNTKIGNSCEQLAVYKFYYKNPEECNRIKRCLREPSSLSINWLGYVSFCDYLGPIGSVRDFPLDQLMRSKLAMIRRNEMKNCDLKCNFIEQVEIPETT